MPIIERSTYKGVPWLINGHFDTIYPALFRKVKPAIPPEKFTIDTPDNDFFDLEHYHNDSDRTVIVSHGLEGNHHRPYVLGMVNAFIKKGWNAIAWSYRGCFGKMNNSIISYHSGFTDDLKEVIQFADNHKGINKIVLVGFSLGGNMTLRYLAEDHLNPKIVAAVAVSVPLELHDSCVQISSNSNKIYANRFLKSLKQKVSAKSKVFSEISTDELPKIRDLQTFDDLYTAPLHGFKDAMDYYNSCSSIYVLDQIKIPTLIINALNDPFLPQSCYPNKLLDHNPNVYLETPSKGGHVGFYSNHNNGIYWSEKRTFEFVNAVI